MTEKRYSSTKSKECTGCCKAAIIFALDSVFLFLLKAIYTMPRRGGRMTTAAGCITTVLRTNHAVKNPQRTVHSIFVGRKETGCRLLYVKWATISVTLVNTTYKSIQMQE
jgi:hypothetical protein